MQRLGLDSLSEDKQISLLTKMTESVIKRIIVAVLEQLSEEDRTVLMRIEEQGDVGEVERFLKEKVSDYNTLTERIVDEFADEMKETMTFLQEGAVLP